MTMNRDPRRAAGAAPAMVLIGALAAIGGVGPSPLAAQPSAGERSEGPSSEVRSSGTQGPEVPVVVGVPRDRVGEVEVRAGDVQLTVRPIEPRPWQVAVVLDQLLSEPLELRNAMVLLGERAEALTALGEVELLLAGETVRSALPPTTDPAVVSEALAWLRLRETTADAQRRIREEFLDEVERIGVDDAGWAEAIAASMAREAEAIRVHREGVLLWAAASRRPGPRLLLLAGSGHDADVAAFYRQWVVSRGQPADRVPPISVRPTAAELGRDLALTGWTVVAFTPESEIDALLAGPQLERAPQEVTTPDGRVVERGVIGFDPRSVLGRGDDGEPEADAPPLRLEPSSGLRPLAEATGGGLVSDPLVLDQRLQEMALRALLAVRPPALGEALPIEVRAAGLREAVAAPRWIGSGAPAALATARARAMLATTSESEGDLEVAALITPGEPPTLRVELSSAGGAEALAPPLRLTVAYGREDGGSEPIAQRALDPGEVAAARVELSLVDFDGDPATTPFVVVVDELGGDRWGGTYASYAAGPGTAVDDGSLLDLPRSAAIRLLAPQDPLLVGRVRFAAAIADPRITEVEFRVDGEREAVRRALPFEAELDLGDLPRTRRVEVIARDGRGEEIGRDALRINSGNRELSIALTAPGAREISPGSIAATGSVMVEARIDRPLTSRVARVDFFWTDRPIGTVFAAPFRQRVDVEAAGGRGFVRAVVTLVDGSTAEDVLFVNSSGGAGRVEVTLVEVLAVVTDREGRPIADLERDAFAVREQGERQEIVTFTGADEVPLTVGVAIDSSASMFVKLPRVQLAAMDFVRDLVTERDRGFVVGFGGDPSLTSPTTPDVGRLVRGIEALRPQGFTSIWKGISYALVQLQGTPGRKALVVYSDGADEDPGFSYRAARRFARVVGVPIYVILSNNEIVRTEGRGLNVRGFLGRLRELVDDVGGRVYFTRVGDDLGDVYRQIAEELRSQYLLAYYGDEDEDQGWRRIEVGVDVPGATVRATRGRYP